MGWRIIYYVSLYVESYRQDPAGRMEGEWGCA